MEKVQRNRNIYVIEEQGHYSQENKCTVTNSSKLIGMKTSKDGEIISTRPHRKFVDMNVVQNGPNGEVTVTRNQVQMMDIIDHMAVTSGVDQNVYAAANEPTARKILSIVRYIVCTPSHTLAGIEEWKYSHPLPCEDGISEEICHSLFTEIGKDAALQRSFFKARLGREGEVGICLAFDCGTNISCSVLLQKSGLLQPGINKDGETLASVRYLVCFFLKTKMPFWFTKLPGNTPDVAAIRQVLNELKTFGVNKVTLVSDNSDNLESCLGEMFGQEYDFIPPGKSDADWVRDAPNKNLPSLKNPPHCPFDPDIHDVTVPVKRTVEGHAPVPANPKDSKRRGQGQHSDRVPALFRQRTAEDE